MSACGMRPGAAGLPIAGTGIATGGAGEGGDAASNSARIVRMRSGNWVGSCHMAQRVRNTVLLEFFGSRASVVRRHVDRTCTGPALAREASWRQSVERLPAAVGGADSSGALALVDPAQASQRQQPLRVAGVRDLRATLDARWPGWVL
jgi:hypothetical protein